MISASRQWLLSITGICLALLSAPVSAVPGDSLFAEDFDGNLDNWTIDASGGGDASIGNLAADSGTALQTRWDPVSITSAVIDADVPAAELSVWVRRGDDNFSEDPDPNEDLIIEYLNSSGSYTILETFAGADMPGEIFNRVYTLDADALHSGMRIRIRHTNGNGFDWDYWHLDTLEVTELDPASSSCGAPTPGALLGTYYDQNGSSRAYFTGNTQSRLDSTVNFNWGGGSPITGFGSNDFSVTWEGQVTPDESGSYTFSTVSDDGVRLYIDNNLVISNWTDHGPRRDTSAAINLTAGTAYNIRMEFYERRGGATARLEWDGPSFGRQIIPSSNLSYQCFDPPPKPCDSGEAETNALSGTYYDQNGSARAYFTGNTETRLDTTVNFNWGNGPAIAGFGSDDFSVIWTGEIETLSAGNYQFSTRSDDGVRLYIDGNLVINNWSDHAPRRDTSAFINLPANTRVDVRMEFYERGGGAVAELEWAGPGFSREIIPTDNLFTQCPVTGPLADYAMEEVQWTGANLEIIDATGNGFDGVSLGDAIVNPFASSTAAITGNPGTCGYGEFPLNTRAAIIDAVDTGIDVDTDIGSTGTIALWYRSNTNWNGGGDRQIFDAAKNAGLKYFFLTLFNNGRLRFGLEDSSDGDFRYNSAQQSFVADEWVHIAVTWDLPNDQFLMYINGSLAETYTPNTNGVIGDMDNLYLGDNNGIYIINNDTTGNSANGAIDEVRVYNEVLTTAQVALAMNQVRPCAPMVPDHIEVVVSGMASTCLPKDVTLRACADAGCTTLYTNYLGTVNLSTLTNNGTWSHSGGSGVFTAGSADSGAATFAFQAGNGGTATLQLSNQRAESLTIGAIDTVDAGLTATSQSLSFSDNAFVITDIDALNDGATGADVAIAGRDHNYRVDLVRRDPSQAPADCGLATDYNNAAQPLKVWVNRSQLLSAAAPHINATALPNSLPAATNITLDFSAGGTANFVLQSSDVGRYTIELQDDSRVFADDIDIIGSSNALTLRPFGFDIDFILSGTADRATNGSGAISFAQDGGGAASATASVFTTAAVPFTTRVSAVQWQAADDTNNDGVPDTGASLANNNVTASFGQEQSAETVSVTHTLAAPVGGMAGVLSGNNFTGFSGGRQQQLMTFSEVGIIDLAASLSDRDYLASGVNVVGAADNLGRFIPDRFIVTGDMRISDPIITEACPSGSFTYLGQDLLLNYELLAVNNAGVTTENYTGDFIKLNNSLGSLTMGAADTTALVDLSSRLPSTADLNANTAYIWGPDMGAALGVGELETTLRIDRATSPDGPYTATVGVLPQDADGVTIDVLDLDVDNSSAEDFAALGDTVQHYGRVFLENAFGPEARTLEMFFIAQNYDATLGEFIPNRDDSCTDYLAADFSEVAGSYTGNLNAGETGISGTSDTIYNAGVGSVLLVPPYVNSTNSNNGSVNIEFTVPAFLQFDWDSNAGTLNTSPVNTATFGSYRGNDRIIYRREVGQ